MNGVSGFCAALLLAAGVAAAVSAGTVRFSLEKPPRIASVRLASLTAGYVTRALREGGDSKKALAAAREWGARLEEALVIVAARRGVVLLTRGSGRRGRRGPDERGRGGELAVNTPLNKEKKNDDNR